jgi:phosphatidylethanolamine/phosphatidyl-N-methylethanolamine N-methyltransferase
VSRNTGQAATDENRQESRVPYRSPRTELADNQDSEKRTAEQSARPHRDERLTFLQGFIREPKGVGSIIPSSRFMERRLVDVAGLACAESVVELGPGTGGTTRAFLKAMPAHAALMAIELDPMFADHVRNTVHDPRLVVHQGSAEDIVDTLVAYRQKAPDAVISGIPFSTMPADLGLRIVKAVREALAPGGCFVAYQFRDVVARHARQVFGVPEYERMEFLNIPPMHVWRWRKP